MKVDIIQSPNGILVENVTITPLNPDTQVGFLIKIKTNTFKPTFLSNSSHTIDITGGVRTDIGFDPTEITSVTLLSENDDETDILDNGLMFYSSKTDKYSHSFILVPSNISYIVEKLKPKSVVKEDMSDSIIFIENTKKITSIIEDSKIHNAKTIITEIQDITNSAVKDSTYSKVSLENITETVVSKHASATECEDILSQVRSIIGVNDTSEETEEIEEIETPSTSTTKKKSKKASKVKKPKSEVEITKTTKIEPFKDSKTEDLPF